jgi:hypothetical protein
MSLPWILVLVLVGAALWFLVSPVGTLFFVIAARAVASHAVRKR